LRDATVRVGDPGNVVIIRGKLLKTHALLTYTEVVLKLRIHTGQGIVYASVFV